MHEPAAVKQGGASVFEILPAFAGVLLVTTTFVVLGFDRPYWLDEIYTLGATLPDGSPNPELVFNDIHPPTYYLLANLTQNLFGIGSFATRSVNLVGLAAFVLALWRLRQICDLRTSLVAAVVSTTTYIFLYYAIELRSYFVLFGVCFVITVEWLAHLRAEQRSIPWLLLLATVAASIVHVFGFMLAGATLGALALHSFLAKPRVDWRLALVAVGIFIIDAALIGGSIALSWEWISSNLYNWWIIVGRGPYVAFAMQCIGPLATAAIAAILAPRSAVLLLLRHSWFLLPAVVTLVASFLFSLSIPIVTTRNLIVVAPSAFLMFAMLLMMPALPRRFTGLACATCVVVAAVLEAPRALKAQQNFNAAFAEVLSSACRDAPVTYISYDLAPPIFGHAASVFGLEPRPHVPAKDFPVDARQWSERFPECQIVALHILHADETVLADVEAAFSARGFAIERELLPGCRIAQCGTVWKIAGAIEAEPS